MGAVIARLAVPLFVKLALVIMLALAALSGYLMIALANQKAATSKAETATAVEHESAAQRMALAESALRTAVEQNQKTEFDLNQKLRTNDEKYQTERTARAASDAARDVRDQRLRAQLRAYTTAARAPAAGASSNRAAVEGSDDPRVATLGALVDSSIGVVGRGRQVVAALAAQVSELQDYAMACYSARSAGDSASQPSP